MTKPKVKNASKETKYYAEFHSGVVIAFKTDDVNEAQKNSKRAGRGW